MTALIYRSLAHRDLADIIAHLEREAGHMVAGDYVARFEKQMETIREYPLAFEARPQWGRHARRGLVPPFVIIYDYDKNAETVTILRVLHGGRHITRKLINR